MERQARALGWLQRAVLGVFVLALCAGIFEPVYTDEIGWRFQERAALDGVDKLFSDTCGPNTLAAPPFFMMPVRAYSAFFNTSFADPFYVRLSGVLYALAWLALLLVLIRRLASEMRDRVALALIGSGLMCLGVLPLLLVWSRPEQPIVLCVTAALALALSGDRAGAEASAGSAWLRSIAIVLLAIIALSYHLKAIFFTLVFLGCLAFASRGARAVLPRMAMGALLIVVTGFAARYWIHRLQCPDDPILFAAYAQNNMGVALTNSRNLSELLAAVGKIAGNVSLLPYFAMPVPRPDHLSSWLAPNQISLGSSFRWFLGLTLVWGGAVLVALFCIFGAAREAWARRRIDMRPALAVILLVTLLGWSATQAIRNFYEACLFLPMLMLVILLAIAGRRRGNGIDLSVRALAVIVGVLAIASPIAIAAIYAPSFMRAGAQKGYLAEQPYSVPVFGYADLKPQIVKAARQCGIGDPAKARALMIDDVTYFTFMKSRLPQHRLGVVGLWRGTISDPVAYLKSRNSSGAILGCHLLPDDLRQRARQEGAFCCLGPPNW